MIRDVDRLVPISDIDSGNVVTQLKFPPYVDGSRIGIDLNRISRIMRVGGIGELVLVGNMNPNALLAVELDSLGMKYEINLPPGKVGIFSGIHGVGFFENFDFVGINTDIIDYPESWGGAVRSAEAWANIIDHILKDSILHLCTGYLLNRCNPERFLWPDIMRAALLCGLIKFPGQRLIDTIK